MPIQKIVHCLVVLLLISSYAVAAPNMTLNEKRTEAFYSTIQNNPAMLRGFLAQMPKGADVQSRLSGAIYSETLLSWASEDNYCLTPAQELVPSAKNVCPKGTSSIQTYLSQVAPILGVGTGHSWASLFSAHIADAAATVAARLDAQKVLYTEQAISFFPEKFSLPAEQSVFGELPIKEAVEQIMQFEPFVQELSAARAILDSIDDSADEKKATLRLLHSVPRTVPEFSFFVRLVFACELAAHDPRVVGITLSGAEDSAIALAEYSKQLAMMQAMLQLPEYHNVNVAIPAGSLSMQRVTPEHMRFHIREAVTSGVASRISNGTAVMYEDNAFDLLGQLRKKNIAVTVPLQHESRWLGAPLAEHPLPVYLQYGVPVVLGTEESGLGRGDITGEYVLAASAFDLTYHQLKMLSRNSLEYSFLAGESLWEDLSSGLRVNACKDSFIDHPTGQCDALLKESERARLQWKLEGYFTEFERKVADSFIP